MLNKRIISALVGTTLLCWLHAQKLDERLSGFEKNGEAWTVDSTDFISITGEETKQRLKGLTSLTDQNGQSGKTRGKAE